MRNHRSDRNHNRYEVYKIRTFCIAAIGGNEQSALMMGLNVKRTKMAAYLLTAFLQDSADSLFCMNSCAGSVEQAKGLEMDAISAAVIRGYTT